MAILQGQMAGPQRMQVDIIVICIVIAVVRHVSGQEGSDLRETELKRLQQAYEEESKQPDRDFQKMDALNRQMGALWPEIQRDKAAHFHVAWKAEADAKKKKRLAEELVAAAVQSDQPDLVVEVASNGSFAEKEIKLPELCQRLPLKALRTFPYSERPDSTSEPEWVVRRMTKNRFELWIPRQGWLFDTAGDIVNEARPPRRDGRGREWFGAFLPDGRWVTTDLWEMDRTLSFFSNNGRLEKEISSLDLVPYHSDAGAQMPALIGWCRCDRDGRGFVLSVGANGGWGMAWVNWAGERHLLQKAADAWRLCYPRDLEPKGMYTVLSIPDDKGHRSLVRTEPGHGSFVGFPEYWNGKVSVVIPNGETFGFWPKSDNVYIVAGRWEAIDPPPDAEHKRDAEQKTWFYDGDGAFGGWIAAGRIADTPKGDGMLFRDASDRVIAVTKTYEVNAAAEFLWSPGTTARPFKLFPDLKLGFFVRDKELVLAAW